MYDFSRDPVDIDFDRHEKEGAIAESKRPVCEYCDQAIWDDDCYEIEPGEYVCRDCITDYLQDRGYLKTITEEGEIF